MKWLRRTGLGMFLVVVAFLIFAFVSAYIVDNQLYSQMPDESLLVDIGGRNIHAYTSGMDNPDDLAVVFVSCLGCNSGLYQAVQPGISESVRTYAFDQAGMTWSDSGELLTPTNIASDLGAFLQHLEEEQVILVGFSAGMLPIHAYYADPVEGAPEVVGLVSLEGAILTDYEASLYADSSPLGLSPFMADLIIESGIARLLAPMLQMSTPDTISNPDYWNLAQSMSATRRTVHAWHNQYSSDVVADIETVVQLDPPEDVLVYVFDPDNSRDLEDADEDRIAYTNELNENYVPYYQHWIASAFEGSRYIPVADSSHFVMLDQPQVVVDNVLELVASLRTKDS